MRNLVKIVVLIMLTAGLSSCEKIRSIFDVEFDTTLSGDLDIDIQEDALKSTNNYEFHSSATVNPLDDEDIEEYIDNIKDFAVNGVVAEVVYVNKGNVVFKQGTSFSIYDSNDKITWTLGGDWEIAEGTKITLDDISGVYEAVADILDKKGTFMVGADGVSSETDVSITIRLSIDTKVTANPL
ncbi:MAG: hypothetical protein KAT15_04115 [Bacteroidales bacterium]|nr:hypothetical protein [Bacteroidales bacterium]